MRSLLVLLVVPICSIAALEPAAHLATVAGTGTAGHSGDGGAATKAQLDQPFHCDLGADGTLFIAESGNHCIRAIDRKTGTIRTVAGTPRQKGSTGDGGPATAARLNEPYAVAVTAEGDLYIVDRVNAVIRKVDHKSGTISAAAGGFREPNDCCLDNTGGLLIADVADWRVRRLDLKTGRLTTVAGIGKPKEPKTIRDRAKLGDSGLASAATLAGPRGVCVDTNGNTFICEREGNAVRKIDAKGIITTIAGTGGSGYSGDNGPARSATFKGPKGIRCDPAGNLYVVDTENHAIRRIDAVRGLITTIAGGQKGPTGLDRPHGCVVAADGTLYIADSNNQRVTAVGVSHR